MSNSSDIAAVAQISSFAIGLEGFGDNVSINDRNGFVSNADSIKQQAALEALSSLDFTKRMTRMLFTADFSQDGIVSDGSIIGWRKMFDAAGYIVSRHDVFRNLDVTFMFTAAQLAEKQKFISEYIRTWVLSFYELDETNVVAWLDDSTERDSYYIYTVVAYQNATFAQGKIFSVPTSPATLSATMVQVIRDEMAELVFSSRPRVLTVANRTVAPVLLSTSAAPLSENNPQFTPTGVDADGISPYPYLSRELYGNDKYDWLIAGANVQASFDRKETVEKIRSFSYVGASLSFISAQITAGRFVVPQDVSSIVKNVEAAIASDGVARTLTEILDGTGMLFFFGDKDVTVGSTDVDNKGTKMLAAIISSIDQSTATMDPRRLTANLSVVLRRAAATNAQTIVDIPLSVTTDHTSDARLADQASQFVGDVSSDASLIDLTTFAGLSRLIRTLRTYFDFNPARTT